LALNPKQDPAPFPKSLIFIIFYFQPKLMRTPTIQSKPLIECILTLLFWTFLFTGCHNSTESPSGVLISNIHIIDVTNGTVSELQSLLVKGDSIHSFLPSTDQTYKKSYQLVDGKNGYLIPGLFDMHVHLGTNPSDYDRMELTQERLS